MNAHNPPVRQFVPDWSDPESDEAWERYASGEFDQGRIDAWARIEQRCADLIAARPEPDHTEARRRADEAVADLVAPLTRRQREDRRKVQERIARDRRMAVRRNCQEWSK